MKNKLLLIKSPLRKKKHNDFLDYIIIPLGFFLLLKFVIAFTVIQSGSMEPTLATGDTVIFNRLAYINGTEAERGDIILFYSDEFHEYMGKRVIGTSNDEISFLNGNVIVNGNCLDESQYIAPTIKTECESSFRVPEGCVFVLGDNRENSYDSRFYKAPFISKKKICGKMIIKIPFSIQKNILHKF